MHNVNRLQLREKSQRWWPLFCQKMINRYQSVTVRKNGFKLIVYADFSIKWWIIAFKAIIPVVDFEIQSRNHFTSNDRMRQKFNFGNAFIERKKLTN